MCKFAKKLTALLMAFAMTLSCVHMAFADDEPPISVGEIIGFGEYGDELTVPFGTGEEEVLDLLPDELTATVIFVAEESENSEQEEPETEEEPGESETVTISVTWQSEGYNGEAPGDYIFTAELPSEYALAESVSLPEIIATVAELELDGIEISEDTLELEIGETAELEAELSPDGASAELLWLSSDEDVATVDDNGLVTAIAAGEAAITVSAGDLADKCLVTVSETEEADKLVTEFEGLDFDVLYQYVSYGAKKDDLNLPDTLTATVDGEEGFEISEITWACDNCDEEMGLVDSEYAWTAVLPDGYILDEGTELPVIYVLVDGGGSVGILDDGSLYIGDYTSVDMIQKAIDAALKGTVEGDVVTVTGEFTGARKPSLELNIPEGVTADWQAAYQSDETYKTSFSLINYDGKGTLLISDNAYIYHKGKGNAITANGANLVLGAKDLGTAAFVIGTAGMAIEAAGKGTNVTINDNGFAMNYATSNINPVVNMTNTEEPGLLIINGGGVGAESASRNYAVQTYGNVIVNGGEVASYADSGRAINLVGKNSNATVTGGEIYASGSGGVAVSTATTAISGVDAEEAVANSSVVITGGNVWGTGYAVHTTGESSKITIKGGTVWTESSDDTDHAVYSEGDLSTVTVTGGSVTANAGDAIRTRGTLVEINGNEVGNPNVSSVTGDAVHLMNAGKVTVSGKAWVWTTTGNAIYAPNGSDVTVDGGFVFAYGDGIEDVVTVEGFQPVNPGVVAAWDTPEVNLYLEGQNNGLIIEPEDASPANNTYWHSEASQGGIHYKNGGNDGFFPLADVGVATSYSLIFDTEAGKLYKDLDGDGIVDGGVDGEFTDYPTYWDIDPNKPDVLVLKGLLWITDKPAALTVINGDGTLEVEEASSFISFAKSGGGTYYGVRSTGGNLTIEGAEALQAFAQAYPDYQGSGTFYGVKVENGNLNVNGSLRALSGAYVPSVTAYGADCAEFTLGAKGHFESVAAAYGTSGDKIEGNMGKAVALNADDVHLPEAYTYIYNTKTDPNTGVSGLMPGGGYSYSKDDIRLTLSAVPVAVMGSADIRGTVGQPLGTEGTSLVVTLYNTTAELENEDVTSWFTRLPAGIKATAISDGATITVTFSGTPLTAGETMLQMTIPEGATADGRELTVIQGGTSKITITDVYSVTYYPNNGDEEAEPSHYETEEGKAYTIAPNPFSRTGYTFHEWNTKIDGTGTSYAPGNVISNIKEDLELYAQWTAIEYTLSFNANGGDGEMVSKTVAYGQELVLPQNTFIRTGYSFAGWGFTVGASAIAYADQEKFTWETTGDLTLYAQWTRNNAAVEFYNNYDSADNTHYTIGEEANKDSAVDFVLSGFVDPSRDGYTFTGWFDARSDGNEYKPRTDTVDVTPLKLYAHWTANTYTITFHGNNGETNTQTAMYGQDLTLTANSFTKAGYTFAGWSASVDGDVTYTDSYEFKPWTLTGNLNLYARWTPNIYKVVFNGNGGQGEMADQSAMFDQTLTLIGNSFIKAGYSFAGWSDSANGEVKYADGDKFEPWTFTADINLYAVWTADTYTVKFNSNGGSGSMSNQTAKYDQDLTLTANSFTRTDYGFAGWSDNANGDVKYADGYKFEPWKLTADLNLYAVWTAGTYTVTFNENGGTGSMANQAATYDQDLILTANSFTRTGYSFAGWSDSADGEVKYADGHKFEPWKLTVNLDLYAVWTANRYKIVYNRNAGSGMMANQTVSYDDMVTLTEGRFTRDGYSFSGWADGDGVKYADGQEFEWQLTSDLYLYAQWEANSYAVTYDGNGGTGEMPDQPVTFDQDTSLSGNGFSRTGYSFVGWNTMPNGSGIAYSEGQEFKPWKFTSGLNLYAQWEAKSYTVRFYSNDGSGMSASQAAAYDQNLKLSANKFSRTGYAFKGWNTDPKGGGTVYGDGQEFKPWRLDADLPLYAQWEAMTYTVSYDANGGTGAMPNQTAIYDRDLTLSANSFVRNGYNFAGWKDDSGTDYAGMQAFTPWRLTSDLKLYAQWAAKNETVEFMENYNDNDGAHYAPGEAANANKRFGDTLAVFGDPVRAGYAFRGWFDARSGGTKYTPGSSVINETDGTLTLYAQWEAVSYTISFDGNGGGGAMANQTAVYGSPLELSPNGFTKVGYTFSGWNDGSGTNYTDRQSFAAWPAAADVTLYAQWTANSYTVAYDANGGNGGMENQTAVYGQSLRLAANQFYMGGHEFNGWNTASGGTGTSYADGYEFRPWETDGGLTLYAQWLTIYTVRYYSNGGVGSVRVDEAKEGLSYTIMSVDDEKFGFARLGYKFKNWNTKADGGGTSYEGGQTIEIAADTALYAQWEALPYEVIYLANDGTDNRETVEVLYGGEVTLLGGDAFTREGYTLESWNISLKGSGKAYRLGETIPSWERAGTLNLYAQWKNNEFEPLTIAYDPNGGTGVMKPDTVVYGDVYTAPLCAFTRSGYRFIGWSFTAADEGYDLLKPGITAAIESGFTLYACWEPVPDGGNIGGSIENGGDGTANVVVALLNSMKYDDTLDAMNPDGLDWAYDGSYVSMSVNAGERVDYKFEGVADGWYTVLAFISFEGADDDEGHSYIVTRSAHMSGGQDVTLTEIVAEFERKESRLSPKSDELPVVHVDNLPELFDDGSTVYDDDDREWIYDSGIVEMVLNVDEVPGNDKNKLAEYAESKDWQMVQSIDLSAQKDWLALGNEVPFHTESLPDLTPNLLEITVTLAEELQGERIDAVYRRHMADSHEEIHEIPEGEYNKTGDGEYFTQGDGVVVLYVNKFSGYAFAVETTKPTPPQGGDNNNGSDHDDDDDDGRRSSSGTSTGENAAAEDGTDLLNTDEHFAYVHGIGYGLFAPDKGMTRAEAAQMFYNLLRDQNAAAARTFPDVADGAWYEEAVEKLASVGIISGFPDGYFRPQQDITRAEFAAMIVQFTSPVNGVSAFSDVPAAHWAYGYINTAANLGWISGMGDGRFEPDRGITRAEAVAVVNTMLKRRPDEEYIDAHAGLVRYTDVIKDHWAYYQIMEASNLHEYTLDGEMEVWTE